MPSRALSQKHPIIFSSDHLVTQVIIEDHHRKVGHCGMASTWISLRQSLWIVEGTATGRRKILSECMFCQRRNSEPIYYCRLHKLCNIMGGPKKIKDVL